MRGFVRGWLRGLFVVWLGLCGCAYSAHGRASGWLLIETERIQMRTNVERGAAVRLATEMQRMYDVLAKYALSCTARGENDRVAVTVMPVWQFEEFAQPGVRGFYRWTSVTWLPDQRGQIVLPGDLDAESKQVFLHELTHRLVEACFVGAPDWLNEGLAGFFETVVVDDGKVTFGRPPYLISRDPWQPPRSIVHQGQRLAAVSFNALPTIESIVGLTGAWNTHDWGRETMPRYALAWALVHFLEIGAPDLTPRFQEYLAELRKPGNDPRQAFAIAFEGVPLQERLNEYMLGGSFQTLQSRPSELEERSAGPPPRVRELPEEEGHLHLAWLGALSDDNEDRARVRLHLTAARQNPRTRSSAHLVAAYALWQHDDLAAADRELQEGLQEAPDDPALLQAHLDLLLWRKADLVEVQSAAQRLRLLAKTGGQLCSLAAAALRAGDRKAAIELTARGLALDPRLVWCRARVAGEAAPQ